MPFFRAILISWLVVTTAGACALEVEGGGEEKACDERGACADGYACDDDHRCVPAESFQRGSDAGPIDALREPASPPGTDSEATALVDAFRSDVPAPGPPDAAHVEAGCGEPAIYYRDADGDGFGLDGEPLAICDPAPPGWVAEGGDCKDDDPGVFPGQPAYFGSPYETAGGDSYDYDCSGHEEEDPSSPGAAPDCSSLSLLGIDCGRAGYSPTSRSGSDRNPQCGSTELVTCVSALLACAPSFSQSAPKRCR